MAPSVQCPPQCPSIPSISAVVMVVRVPGVVTTIILAHCQCTIGKFLEMTLLWAALVQNGHKISLSLANLVCGFVFSGLLPIVQCADHQKPLGSDIPGSGSAPSRLPDTCPSPWPALHQSGWLRSLELSFLSELAIRTPNTGQWQSEKSQNTLENLTKYL